MSTAAETYRPPEVPLSGGESSYSNDREKLGVSVISTNVDESQRSAGPIAAAPQKMSEQPSAAQAPPVKKPAAAAGKVPWTPLAVCAWFALGIIRGTTAIMLGLAGDDIRPTVIVMLRSPGTVSLFVLVMVIWSAYSPTVKATMKETLSMPSTYAKLAVLGVIQSGGPFLLFTYGLIHVPASFGGAFMALVPMWTVIIDQTLFRALGFKTGVVNKLKVMGMVTCVAGAGVYILPTLLYDYSPEVEAECNNSSNSTATLSKAERRQYCATSTQVAINIVELLCGSLLFGLAAVYWRNFKGKIHFTLAGGGQTVVGGVVALIFWGALDDGQYDPDWNPKSIGALMYLMVCSGFMAAMLLFYLYGKIGAVPTARVMCLVPIVSWVEDRLIYLSRGSHGVGIEALGLFLLIVGLILFEGRVDQVCGFNVPCVMWFRKQQAMKRFKASLAGDAEFQAKGLSTRLMESEFEGVQFEENSNSDLDMSHMEMAKYSSSVGEFEVVF